MNFMKRMAEIIEDISLVADIIFTLIAVMFGNLGKQELSNLFFMLSGIGLIIALISMVIKRVCYKKDNN